MPHIPYGYEVIDGQVRINEEQARTLRQLYQNYLSGMSLRKAAAAVGLNALHTAVKHILENKRYLGDDFYPAIIEKETFDKAADERIRRATALGRMNYSPKENKYRIPTSFRIKDPTKHFEDPKTQAEYLYTLIESENNECPIL